MRVCACVRARVCLVGASAPCTLLVGRAGRCRSQSLGRGPWVSCCSDPCASSTLALRVQRWLPAGEHGSEQQADLPYVATRADTARDVYDVYLHHTHLYLYLHHIHYIYIYIYSTSHLNHIYPKAVLCRVSSIQTVLRRASSLRN